MEPDLEDVEARLRAAYAELEPRPGFRTELSSQLRPRGFGAMNWAALGSVAAVVLAVAGIGVLMSRPHVPAGTATNLAPMSGSAERQGAAGGAAKSSSGVSFGALPYPPSSASVPAGTASTADGQLAHGAPAPPPLGLPQSAPEVVGGSEVGNVFRWTLAGAAEAASFQSTLQSSLPAGWSVTVQAGTFDAAYSPGSPACATASNGAATATSFAGARDLLPAAYQLQVFGNFVRFEPWVDGAPVVGAALEIGVQCGRVTSASGPIPHGLTGVTYELRTAPPGAVRAYVQVADSRFGYYEPVYIAPDGSVTPALLDRDLRRQ